MLKKIVLIIILGILAVGCSGQYEASQSELTTDELKTVKEPEYLELYTKDWSEIEELAQGSEVRIFMWGGDEGINRYIDTWVTPNLLEQQNVNLRRMPMNIDEVLQKLMTEKRAGFTEGTIDVIWLNGENFKNAKENGLLWGTFADYLPNVQKYTDTNSFEAHYDFGTAIEGYEAPWGKVQFVFAYDSDKVATPPRDFIELQDWILQNPGKFTYPEASDFTGNAFLRHLLYYVMGGPGDMLASGYEPQLLEGKAELMWQYLRDIKPGLWRAGTTYPASLDELDRLYSRGEVWMTMGYNEARVESLIANGIFPDSTRTFVLESASIGNTHFLSIPFNSPNKAAALVTINYLLSPEAQYAKMLPDMWGENMSLDPNKLPIDFQDKVANIQRGQSVLPVDILQKYFVPEIDAEYVNWIEERWLDEVVR